MRSVFMFRPFFDQVFAAVLLSGGTHSRAGGVDRQTEENPEQVRIRAEQALVDRG